MSRLLPRAGARLFVPFVLAVLFVQTARAALAPEERRFLWDEANTRLAHARAPAGFLAAAADYEALAADGVHNGALFYNLGTAYLQAGRFEDARRALERAERYDGAAVDVRRNWRAAMAGLQKSVTPDIPWDRAVFAWHYALSCAVRTWLATGCFFSFWLCLTILKLRPRAPLRTAALAALGLSLILGTSVLTTVLQERQAARAAPVLSTERDR